jgi:Ca-activated chloride channel family protein
MLRRVIIAGLVATSFTQASAQEAPYPDTIIVLDASNSMWGRIEGEAKILIARKVIGDLVTNLKEPIQFGLVAYGHRARADCSDIETVMPVGRLNPEAYKAAVNSLTPQGRTPLTAAVRMAAEELHYTTRSARIILVSDGVESCNGDPAALAEELHKNALDLTIHVIGFNLSGTADPTGLEALAKLNGGLYLTPDTSKELKDDLNQMMDMSSSGGGPRAAALPDSAMPANTPDASTGAITTDSAAPAPSRTADMAQPAATTAGDTLATHISSAPTAPGHTEIAVTFSGPIASGDYIGLATEHGTTPLVVTPAKASGSAMLRTPQSPGRYALRYYDSAGKVLASQLIEVK